MLRASSSLVVGALVVAGLLGGCSSSSGGGSSPPPPCNESPFECPAGQTCWLDSAGTAFACLDSAAGVAVGATCVNTVGTPTCGDGELCYQSATGAGASGTCAEYCDPTSPAHGCAAGYACAELELETSAGLTTHVCVSTATGGMDAGPDGSSGADASASDATSG